MNLFSKIHDSIINRIPHHIRRSKFFFIGLLVFTLPITLFLTKQIQDVRQRASEIQISTGVPDSDPITNELYDINIWASPATVDINSNQYADISFKISGSRIKELPGLYGIRQNPNNFEKVISFGRTEQGEYVEFNTLKPVTTYQQEKNCIDLFSSQSFSDSSYVASFCYNPVLVTKSTERTTIWSLNANQYVSFIYTGENPSFVITVQSAYLKKNGLNHWHHVNFFGMDPNTPTKSFEKVIYQGQWILGGMLNNSFEKLCKVDSTYFKISSMAKPEGGSNVAAQRTGEGTCSFEYDSPTFLPHFQSLDTNIIPGGYFAYLASLSSAPSAVPTYQPTPVPSYQPTPYPTKPYPTPQPTIGPAKVTIKTPHGYFYAEYIYVSLDGKQITIPEVTFSNSKASNSMVALQGKWTNDDADYYLSLYYDLIGVSSWTLNKISVQKITQGTGTVTNYDVSPIDTVSSSQFKSAIDQTFQSKYAEFHENVGSPKVAISLGNVSTQPFFLSISPTPTPPYTPYPSKSYPSPSEYPITPYPTLIPSWATPAPTKTGTKYSCDFNKDRLLDIVDYSIWLKQFIDGGKPQSPASADCDQNGKVDIFDYNLLLRELRGIYQ